MITYNDIYEAARKERYSEQLQKIPKNFISEIADYLKEKKQVSLKEEDEFSDEFVKVKKQLENATTMFKELMLRRRKKLLNLVLVASETGISKQDFDNMLDVEKELFENIMQNVEDSDKKANNLLSGSSKQEEEKNSMIVFKEDVGEFVGFNGDKMGPFKKGQITNLPKEVAKIFIDDKKADKIEK
jgi:DNA replication initiation complex subunit (GINS family)